MSTSTGVYVSGISCSSTTLLAAPLERGFFSDSVGRWRGSLTRPEARHLVVPAAHTIMEIKAALARETPKSGRYEDDNEELDYKGLASSRDRP